MLQKESDKEEAVGMEDEIYYLKETELKLLLAGMGLKRWYGLFSDESSYRKVPEIPEVNRVLVDLYQNEVIEWKDGSAAVKQPYARVLSAMLEQKRCVIMQLPDDTAPVYCCYLSQRTVVVIQKSQRESATFGILELSVQSWLQFVEEEADRLEEGNCLELACRSSETGRIYQKIWIQPESIRIYRINLKNKDTGGMQCFRENFREKIKELLSLSKRGV